MTRISVAEVREFLRELVERVGADYVAPPDSCRYFDGSGAPCCIVGHVFDWAGLTAEDFTPEYNEQLLKRAWEVVGSTVFDQGVFYGLQAAQHENDKRHSWGEAYQSYVYATRGF